MSELTFMGKTRESRHISMSEYVGVEQNRLLSLGTLGGFSTLLNSLRSDESLSETAEDMDELLDSEEDEQSGKSKVTHSSDGLELLTEMRGWGLSSNGFWRKNEGGLILKSANPNSSFQTKISDPSGMEEGAQFTKEQNGFQATKSLSASSELSLRQEAKQAQLSMSASGQAESVRADSPVLSAEKSSSVSDSIRAQMDAEILRSELLKSGESNGGSLLGFKSVSFKNCEVNGMQNAVNGVTMKGLASYKFSGKKGETAVAGISSTSAAKRSSGVMSAFTSDLSRNRESKTLIRNAVQGLEASGSQSSSYRKSENLDSFSASTSSDPSVEFSRTLVAQLSPVMLKQIEQMKKKQRSHINLTLDLPDGQSLEVRLSLIGSAVKVRFDAESVELQSGLRRGWSELQALASDAGLELAQPEFQSNNLSTAEFRVDDSMNPNNGKAIIRDSMNQYA